MSLEGQYISIGRIIEEVYGDNKYDFSIEFDDVLRWTATVLKLVNHPDIFIKKVTGHESDPNLDIDNYKAKLPCDFYRLEQIAVDGYPALYAGHTFHHLLGGECCGINGTSSSTDQFIDNFGNTFDRTLGNTVGSGTVTFDINNDYITLSTRTGQVCIAYLAFPTDSDGFPMVPADEQFVQLVKNYVTLQLDRIAWRLDPNNNGKKAIYNDSQTEYAWSAGKASSYAKMPNLEKMEAIKNQMVRLKPIMNHHDSFYKFLGNQERRYNH